MLRANYTFSEKQNKYIRAAYLCSFLIPVAVLLTILIVGKVFPFGNECYLRTDMYHQYAPFMSEFREKLQTGGSLLYSWDIGMGVNFTSLYAYYLASPFNYLVAFCPKQYVIEFMTVMTVLKAGLSGLAMAFYLKQHSKSPDFGIAFFAVFYALSGYVCAYYWNVMWMDCIILFPLIIYGFEKLMRGESAAIYAFALGLSILSNYYISIMICMFLIIYFVMYQFLDKPEDALCFFKRGISFAVYSLLAGGLAAVLLLPEIAALRQTASADISFPKTYSAYFSIVEMFARHLPMVETEQALEHWPNIYMGTMVLVLLPIYLVTPGIKLSEKIVYMLMVFVMLAGFAVNVLNFIWHGLHYPNSLPARQSFIYIFLMLYICFRTYSVRRFITPRQLTGAVLFAIAFILYSEQEAETEHFKFWVFYLSIAIVLLYSGVLTAYLKRHISPKRAAFFTMVLVVAELTANTAYTGITTTSRDAYTEDNEDVRALTDSLIPASDFFRVEKMNRKTKNDGAWMNFPSVSLFSSMASADCSDIFEKLGCEASTNAYSINGSTPFVNMLLSVKYGIYDEPQENGEEKTFIESRGESYLYQNNYALPVGFVLPQDPEDWDWVMEFDNPALVQTSICDVLGVETVLKPNSEIGNSNGKSYAVTIGEDGEYYAYVKNHKIKKVTVKWPDKTRTFENVNRGYLLELGKCFESELIKIESETDTRDMDVELYRFDYAALKEAYDALSAMPLKLNVWEDDHLKGRVNVTEPGFRHRLLLTIPYDEGWTVKVDGVETETVKTLGCFMGVDLSEGEHEIELSFMPKGLKEGAVISGASLAVLLLLLLIRFFMDTRRRKAVMAAEALEYLDDEYPEEETDDDSDEVCSRYLTEAYAEDAYTEDEYPKENTEPVGEDDESETDDETDSDEDADADDLERLLSGSSKTDYISYLEAKEDIVRPETDKETKTADNQAEIDRLIDELNNR